MIVLQMNKFFYPRGGAERVFLDTAALLRREGHRVIVFSMEHPLNGSWPDAAAFVSRVDADSAGLREGLRFAGRMLYSFEAQRKLGAFVREQHPDIAHLHNVYHQLSPSVIRCLKERRVPAVMTLHDFKVVCPNYSLTRGGAACDACGGGKYYRCFALRCVKGSRLKSLLCAAESYLHRAIVRSYDSIDTFISPSLFLERKIRELGFQGRVVVIPNFVDFPARPAAEPDRGIYFGRLCTGKGLTTLLDACSREPQVRMSIAGDGPLRESLERLARERNLGNVRFLGNLDGPALSAELARAVFSVLPADAYENQPRSILESFAAAKPVIASRIGGIPELVRDGQTGYLFEAGNAEGLGSLMVRMCREPAAAAAMGERARAEAQRVYSAAAHYRSLMKVYEGAVRRMRDGR